MLQRNIDRCSGSTNRRRAAGTHGRHSPATRSSCLPAALRVLRRHARVIAVTVLIGMLVTGAVLLSITSQYKASVVVFVDPRRDADLQGPRRRRPAGAGHRRRHRRQPGRADALAGAAAAGGAEARSPQRLRVHAAQPPRPDQGYRAAAAAAAVGLSGGRAIRWRRSSKRWRGKSKPSAATSHS